MKTLKRIGRALVTIYSCVVILLVFLVVLFILGLIVIKDLADDYIG